ncbi:CPBP family intramembrane glutamic endopeptidase [Occallatibacter riparius]|uniref:CPBP family intramembrane metalloprotease n=1 Tax=Occallatibacter riparius TaxID=1002689 RepID=A0A9J7BG19_9BACT|nr:CPBP family intramembrane glutamic endopeptidase [Occallatibacter riparius]UWZ81720.1 CPBP family intramembrane metalloprotease [Occallatibacter riparius]
MPHVTPLLVIAAVLAMAPYLAAAFFADWAAGRARTLPAIAQMVLPALLCFPYVLVSVDAGAFSWRWLAVYAVFPAAIALAARAMPEEAVWSRLVVLLVMGLAVDLRWFEPAWPAHLSVFNKVLLLDAGIYAFVMLRPLEGTGFDLRLRRCDVSVGLKQFLFYLPIALVLGLALGFLHTHALSWGDVVRLPGRLAFAWVFTFFFIAVPEELFFRGWVQNLLERRLGRSAALVLAAILFGLAHFNKRALHFNWRYVLLAAIAGVFYGRAWREKRRVGASAVTHATVDSVWSLFLR